MAAAKFLRRDTSTVDVAVGLSCLPSAGTHLDHGGAYGHGGVEFATVAVGISAVSCVEAAFVLDHDLVLVRAGGADGDRNIFSRSRMVMGLALGRFLKGGTQIG